MNKRCLALEKEEYMECIRLLREGFSLEKEYIRSNERIATIVIVQSCLGLRIGDVLSLKLSSFVRDGGRYRIDIHEDKTDKVRTFTVPLEVYSFIQDYALKNNIGVNIRLFPITERQVQRHIKKVFKKMGLDDSKYSTHSFRKYFATSVYMNNEYNIELVRILLQHSSIAVTQKYIGIGSKIVEDALSMTSGNLI